MSTTLDFLFAKSRASKWVHKNYFLYFYCSYQNTDRKANTRASAPRCSVFQNGVRDNKQMRPPGIEPGLEAWEATVIPLDHGRILLYFF